MTRRPRPGTLQAGSDSSPVSEQPRTTVGPICRSTASRSPVLTRSGISAFRQPSPTCRTAFPAQHLRPSGVLSCWPDGLELTPRFYPGSNKQYRLQTVLGVYLKHTRSRDTSASSASGVLNDYALYKSTHSLTHLTPDENGAEDDLQTVEEVVADDDDRRAAGRPTFARTDRLDRRRYRRQKTYTHHQQLQHQTSGVTC